MMWSDLVRDILKKGSFLSDEGIYNWALTKTDALIALDELFAIRVAILGGDVCSKIDGRYSLVGDNWYCDRNESESHDEFLIRSYNVAKKYIEKYDDLSGCSYFIIVPEDHS